MDTAKERADQLSDLFSSVMGDDIPMTNAVSDDILFGASAETLMKSEEDFVGFKGELLNHTHTQRLQIEYEFVRQPSRYGARFNQIKLIFVNKWDKQMRGSVYPRIIWTNRSRITGIFSMVGSLCSSRDRKGGFHTCPVWKDESNFTSQIL